MMKTTALLALVACLAACSVTPQEDASAEAEADALARFPSIPAEWRKHTIYGQERQLFYTEDDGEPVIFWIDDEGKVRVLESE